MSPMMDIETNPVKLAYYEQLRLNYALETARISKQNIEKLTSEFTYEQFKQFHGLIDGSLKIDQVK